MSLDFKTTLDDGPFQKGLKSVERGANATSDKVSRAFEKVQTGFGGMGSALAGALSVGAIVGFGKSLLDMAGNLADSAEGLNINVVRLQQLEGVFEQSGVGSEKFEKALGKVTQALQGARDNTGGSRAAFDALGISWESLDGASPDDVLAMIADSMKSAKDPTEAYAAATEILGRGQMKLIGALKQGSDAINQQALAISTISEQGISDMDALGDAMGRLKKGAVSLFVGLGQGLGDGLANILGGGDGMGLGRLDAKGPVTKGPRKQPTDDPRALAEEQKLREENAKISLEVRRITKETWAIQRNGIEDSATGAERLKMLHEDLAQLSEQQGSDDAVKNAELEKRIALKEIEISKAQKLADTQLGAQMELDKLYAQQRAEAAADKARSGDKHGVKGASMRSGAFEAGGVFSSTSREVGGMGALASGVAYGQGSLLSHDERQAQEDSRVASGEKRTASAGAYGATRSGDTKRRKEYAKEEARKALTLEGTNNLLERILQLQETVWGAK